MNKLVIKKNKAKSDRYDDTIGVDELLATDPRTGRILVFNNREDAKAHIRENNIDGYPAIVRTTAH